MFTESRTHSCSTFALHQGISLLLIRRRFTYAIFLFDFWLSKIKKLLDDH